MRRLFMCLAVPIVLSALPAGASAQGADGQGTDHFVTIVARQCAEYTDITANRARNDIQESLRDLGDDTLYSDGEPIDPATETEGQPDPPCSPIPDWRFTLGTGFETRAVSGPWGSLSIVTDPYDEDVVTLPSTPLLDNEGRPTKDSIAGAVTIELTQEQLDRAGANNSLWIQGGTPDDPILNEVFPDEYGFGALRCAIDNLNGDNVEWISYPSGTEHVFCYAYYVTPPPTSGTIIIRKEVSDPPDADQDFQFAGNLTFNADGRFDLSVRDGNPASVTFYRAETTASTPPWTVREVVPPGWTLEDLSCDSPGASTETVNLATATALINLAAGDTVTCTYTNAFRVPAGRLILGKSTLGGTGLFDFDVFPVGGGDTLEASARTRRPVIPVLAQPSPLEVSPGLYRVRETLPSSRRGEWRLVRVWCGGRRQGVSRRALVRIRDQQGSACLFVNRFIPKGRIEVFKVTVGGTGRFDFAVSPLRDLQTVYHKRARVRSPLTVTRARGDSTRNIGLGRYVIQEIAPQAEGGSWTPRLVVCNGRIRPQIEGRAIVRLTSRQPTQRCTYLNVFTSDPDPPDPPDPPGPPGPPNPPGPGPGPPGPNPAPHRPDPDLVITKQADRPVAAVGERVTYTVTIRNRGPVGTEDVVIGEALERGQTFSSVSGRGSGRCERRTVRGVDAVVCRVGDLGPGASRTLRFTTRITGGAGRFENNVAVVGSSTPETSARNNVATARVRVRGLGCPPVQGSLARTRARAAC
jgi:uncharacterized repeat protein (TIGR01451 family)